LTLIAQWENGLLQKHHEGARYKPLKKSPFKARIRTELLMDGLNEPHSVIKLEKNDKDIHTEVAAGIAKLEALLKVSAPPPKNNRTP
jgi:hypothetical protein